MTYEEFKEKVGSVILTGEGNCPVTPVVQMLQGKWKLQILYELCIKCPMRFGELKKMLKPITNTALTVNAILIVGHSDNEKVYHQHHVPCKIETTLYARRERYGSGDVTLLTNPGSICFR